MLDQKLEAVSLKLKDIIDKEGPSYLSNYPYETYESLCSSKVCDCKTAGAILLFLLQGLEEKVSQQETEETFSKRIQKECSFNKNMSDKLASIFLSLYSRNNEKEWAEKNMQGWNDFLKEEITGSWKGYSVWEPDGGSVDCHYEGEYSIRPLATIRPDKELEKLLEKNPFMTKEDIYKYYEESLHSYLAKEFEEYCSAEIEDYYQPVVEDFEYSSYLEDWCEDNGFEILSSEGDGYDDGYEPHHRGHRYW